MNHLAQLNDEQLEEMYGSYRSLARSHRIAGQWALAHWCGGQSRLIVVELSRRYLAAEDLKSRQLRIS